MATRRSEARVGDVVLEALVVVRPDTPLREVATIIDAVGTGTVLVDSRPLTECTERDLVRALAKGADPDAPVDELALDQPPYVRFSTSLAEALDAMWCAGRPSVLVVSRDGTPLGFLMAGIAFAALRRGPPWLRALEVALHVDASTS